MNRFTAANVWPRSLLLVGLIALGCYPESESVDTDLMRLRRELKAVAAGESPVQGELELAGYNFHSELAWGETHLLLVSTNYLGELLLFDDSGQLVARHRTSEITGFQVCNLGGDQDGVLVTNEKDIEGTGVFEGRFHAYSLRDNTVKELWNGLSRAYWSAESPPDDGRPLEIAGWFSCNGEVEHLEIRNYGDSELLDHRIYTYTSEGANLRTSKVAPLSWETSDSSP